MIITRSSALLSAVLQNIKYAARTDTLPDGSVIPAGSQLLYSPYVINRSRSFCGADADEFRSAASAGMERCTPRPS
jgi:cytochrome P450